MAAFLRHPASMPILCGLALICGLGANPAKAGNLSPGRYAVRADVSDGILNLRGGPGVTSPIVVAVPARAVDVMVTGECRSPNDGGKSSYAWCAATWRGHSGWISSCCVTLVAATPQPLENRPVVSLERTAAIAFEFARDSIDREKATRIAEQVAVALRGCGEREACIREVLLAAIGDYQRIARSRF